MFSHADANSDGVVDSAEALKLAETHFAKLDANSDGTVEKDELKAGRGFFGKHRGCQHGEHGEHGEHSKDQAKKPATADHT
jgi:hypothetical protein